MSVMFTSWSAERPELFRLLSVRDESGSLIYATTTAASPEAALREACWLGMALPRVSVAGIQFLLRGGEYLAGGPV